MNTEQVTSVLAALARIETALAALHLEAISSRRIIRNFRPKREALAGIGRGSGKTGGAAGENEGSPGRKPGRPAKETPPAVEPAERLREWAECRKEV